MCEIIEEYAKEIAEEYAREVMLENIKRLFENGCSLEIVLASVKDIPQEVIRNLYEEVSAIAKDEDVLEISKRLLAQNEEAYEVLAK